MSRERDGIRLSLIEYLGFRSEPNTSVKRKDRREFRQRLKLKKKNAAKKEDGVIDLTTSDNDDIAAASSHSSTEVQAEPNDNINFDDGHSDGNDVADPLLDQRTTQQEHAKTPGNSGEELSDQEAAQLLWRCVLRAREKAAQEGLEPVSPWSSETEEDHDVPWSLEEDEELARWKIGGHSGEMLDWPTFDESRTWEQLMKRLAWLEGQHPKCWAALKAVEEEEQEVFERELSVDIEEMKVKGLLPSSSDEMSEDETETESVEASDEEANEE